MMMLQKGKMVVLEEDEDEDEDEEKRLIQLAASLF